MRITTHPTPADLGHAAAHEGANALRATIQANGEAVCVLATGASQFATLKTLVTLDLPWHRVTLFHLDEYVGLDADHPGSFVRYLWDRALRQLPRPPRQFHFLDGHADPIAEARRLSALYRTPDVTFLGIGENGHLAFNDPPADFGATEPFAVVTLDAACRRQQLGEGWFATLQEVPTHALTMTVPFILKSKLIVASVPDTRKALAVAGAVQGPVTPGCPASALQRHANCALHLDRLSAELIGVSSSDAVGEL